MRQGANRRRRVDAAWVILGHTVHGGFFLISGFVGAANAGRHDRLREWRDY